MLRIIAFLLIKGGVLGYSSFCHQQGLLAAAIVVRFASDINRILLELWVAR